MNRFRYMLSKWSSRTVKATLGIFSIKRINEIADMALRFRINCHEVIRQKSARKDLAIEPINKSWDNRLEFKRSVLEIHASWSDIAVECCSIPGMLTRSERQYYTYLPMFYRGLGAVVELGPWLGLSTHYLINNLKLNPAFAGQHMFVYDDFTWRSSWMDKWLVNTAITSPDNHACFLDLFEKNLRDDWDLLVVSRRKIADYDGNENLPALEWNGGAIEMIIVDCGRPLHVNEAWYRVFSPYFIPNITLIVMQDWQNYKRIPEAFWENTKLFTDSKEGVFDMIHEVAGGGIATFLYRGK